MQIDLEDMIKEVACKVLYIHRKKTNNEIFYVGVGNASRPYNFYKEARSAFWLKTKEKYGVIVEVLETGLTKEQAFKKEVQLIKQIGRRDLNKGPLVNHTNGGDGISGFRNCVIDIVTGEVYLNISVWARYKNYNQSMAVKDLKGIHKFNIRKLSKKHTIKWGISDTYFGPDNSVSNYDPVEVFSKQKNQLIKQLKSYLVNNKRPRKTRIKCL